VAVVVLCAPDGKMEVPTISLAGVRDVLASGGSLLEVVNLIRSACEEAGFFTLVDHGIDQSLLDLQRQACAQFFSRPPQSLIVDMVSSTESRFAWLDYVPDGGDKAAEWSLGPIAGRGSMRWEPGDLCQTWLSYYAAMEELVDVLMKLFALSLDLPVDSFRTALSGHRSSLRAILYPEISEAELAAAGGQVVRNGEHTDWGCVTVLLAEEADGLELLRRDGSWASLQPCGGLIVNLGDLLPYWTGGRWKATRHRVMARSTSRAARLSIPYFGLVNRSTVLEPITCKAESNATEKILTAGEFFDNHEVYMRDVQEVDGPPS